MDREKNIESETDIERLRHTEPDRQEDRNTKM